MKNIKSCRKGIFLLFIFPVLSGECLSLWITELN